MVLKFNNIARETCFEIYGRVIVQALLCVDALKRQASVYSTPSGGENYEISRPIIINHAR